MRAPLDEGTGPEVSITIDGQQRKVPLAASAERQAGHVAAQAVRVSSGGVAEVADAGDFAADAPFSVAAWVFLPANDGGGAIVARMDDGTGLPRMGFLGGGSARRHSHHSHVER